MRDYDKRHYWTTQQVPKEVASHLSAAHMMVLEGVNWDGGVAILAQHHQEDGVRLLWGNKCCWPSDALPVDRSDRCDKLVVCIMLLRLWFFALAALVPKQSSRPHWSNRQEVFLPLSDPIEQQSSFAFFIVACV